MAMTEHDIKVELFRRKITSRALADQAECTPSMIRAVIKGVEKSGRIRQLIARAIGKSATSVFGKAAR